MNQKLLTLESAIEKRKSIETLVFTNGHFDLLHAGHIDYLQKARALGDALFVGLNSDRSTRLLKGEKRPITPQTDRVRVLSALEMVDAIIIFDEPTAHRLLDALRPEVYAKGGDYVLDPSHTGTLLPEAPLVQSYGGHIELIPYLPGYSTTELIDRIRERFCD